MLPQGSVNYIWMCGFLFFVVFGFFELVSVVFANLFYTFAIHYRKSFAFEVKLFIINAYSVITDITYIIADFP